MIFRFFSGSVTPARADTKRSAASTTRTSTRKWSRNSFSTISRSPARRSPVSTKIPVSRSPMARWTMRAATALSIPPEMPQTTRPSPTWAFTFATETARKSLMAQSALSPAALKRKLASTFFPWGVWWTSGWNWIPQIGSFRWRTAA